MSEDVIGGGLSCFHSFVVEGAKGAQIKRNSVLPDTSIPKPCLVHFHHICCHLRESEVFLITKFNKAVDGIGIVVFGTDTLHLLFLGYLLPEEHEHALARWKLLYFIGKIIDRIWNSIHFFVMDDALHLFHLPIYLRLDKLQMCLPVVTVANNDRWLSGIPLFGIDMIVGTDPA